MISLHQKARSTWHKISSERWISFAAIGICVMAVSYLSLFFLVNAIGVTPWLAYIVQAILAVELNFTLNQLITWRDRPIAGKSELLKRLWRFNLARGGLAFVFSWLLFTKLVAAGVDYLVANTVCIGATTIINYFVSDQFVFTESKLTHRTQGPEISIDMRTQQTRMVSVIIPVKHSQRTIRKTVDSLLTQDYPHAVEIILVGDHLDPTWGPLEDLIHEGRIVAIGTDIRTSGRDANAKRNIGIAEANGEVIALTDSDMMLPANWISTGMSLMSKGNDCVTGSMCSIDQGFWGRYVDRNQLGSKTPRMGADYVLNHANFGRSGFKPPVTANVFVSRKLMIGVGGLDPHFVHTYDDYEWFRRIAEHGHDILCTNRLAADHYHRQGFPDLMREYVQSGLGCGDYVRKYPDCHFGRLRVKQLYMAYCMVVALVVVSLLCLLFPFVGAVVLIGGISLSAVSAVQTKSLDGLLYPAITFVLGLAFSAGLTRRLLQGRHLPYKTSVISCNPIYSHEVEPILEEVA